MSTMARLSAVSSRLRRSIVGTAGTQRPDEDTDGVEFSRNLRQDLTDIENPPPRTADIGTHDDDSVTKTSVKKDPVKDTDAVGTIGDRDPVKDTDAVGTIGDREKPMRPLCADASAEGGERADEKMQKMRDPVKDKDAVGTIGDQDKRGTMGALSTESSAVDMVDNRGCIVKFAAYSAEAIRKHKVLVVIAMGILATGALASAIWIYSQKPADAVDEGASRGSFAVRAELDQPVVELPVDEDALQAVADIGGGGFTVECGDALGSAGRRLQYSSCSLNDQLIVNLVWYFDKLHKLMETDQQSLKDFRQHLEATVSSIQSQRPGYARDFATFVFKKLTSMQILERAKAAYHKGKGWLDELERQNLDKDYSTVSNPLERVYTEIETLLRFRPPASAWRAEDLPEMQIFKVVCPDSLDNTRFHLYPATGLFIAKKVCDLSAIFEDPTLRAGDNCIREACKTQVGDRTRP